jgi:DNA invertase Pin-like site-specific DNA recombinase
MICSYVGDTSMAKAITDAGAEFRSLAQSWADTATATGRLMIAVLGGLGDVEREMILDRTSEGRARAMARGVRFGRPPKLNPDQRREALARRAAGETLSDIAWTYGVNHMTIARLR